MEQYTCRNCTLYQKSIKYKKYLCQNLQCNVPQLFPYLELENLYYENAGTLTKCEQRRFKEEGGLFFGEQFREMQETYLPHQEEICSKLNDDACCDKWQAK